ncbi:hypothetical protein BKA64DRAFT_769570 [Cadophora sp. MPI-SDFR-AT-0126]|nr:hypothetical protein BKA64DRAFT_769570 [Leotiomycetes sp. MPI-SDFR-AT-0126]
MTTTQAAIAILDSQQRLFDQTSKHHYKLWLLSFYTVDAAIVLSVITAQYPPQSRESKREVDRVPQQCIQRLSLMAHSDPTAKSGLDIILRCYKNLQQSCLISSALSGVVPSSQSIKDSQHQDTERSFGSSDLDSSERIPLNLPPVPSETLSWDEPDTIGSSFDESFWLRLMGSMDSAADDSILELVSELP